MTPILSAKSVVWLAMPSSTRTSGTGQNGRVRPRPPRWARR
jgi:hypothetical protein